MTFWQRYLRLLLNSMMIFSYLLFSYYYFDGWWYSCIGTILILLFAFLLWRTKFLERTGLQINAKIALATIVLVLLITPAGFWLMKSIAIKNDVIIQYSDYRNYIHDIFYTLNEEIILGALLLGWIRNLFKKLHPIFISILVAVIFSLFHYFFYRWIFLESGLLTLTTLFTLTMVGVLRNNLILTTGHIGYSWAFHVSWMAVMFGTYHYHMESLSGLLEFEKFNLYLGSPLILFIISILALLSSILYHPRFKPQNTFVS